MTREEVQTLVTDSGCLNQCANEKELWAMVVYLLWSGQHEGETLDQAAVQALQAEIACLYCMTPKQLLASMVQLLSTA